MLIWGSQKKNAVVSGKTIEDAVEFKGGASGSGSRSSSLGSRGKTPSCKRQLVYVIYSQAIQATQVSD